MSTVSLRQLIPPDWFDLSQGIRALQPGASTISLLVLIEAVRNRSPMDLVSVATDDNGLLRNPKWGFQITNPGEIPDPRQLCPGDLHNPGPECTTQATSIDSASLCFNEGHVNWFACTYEGPVCWKFLSDWSHDHFAADSDYQWNLQPPGQAGLTVYNTEFIELEFDSEEVVGQFNTPWWSSFNDQANHSDVIAWSMVNGKFAIVTGLIGLDCGHSSGSCSTESHPVYAMAIHVQDDPSDDVWVMFVRNWGNEGWCSHHDHLQSFQKDMYTFRLPWRSGASSVNVSSDSKFSRNNLDISGPGVTPVSGKGVLVSFTLPAAETHPLVAGELHLQWPNAPAQPMHPTIACGIPALKSEKIHSASFWEKLTPDQREVIRQLVTTKAQSPLEPVISAPAEIEMVSTPPIPEILPIELLKVNSVPDLKKIEKDQSLVDALRVMFGGSIPGFPDADK